MLPITILTPPSLLPKAEDAWSETHLLQECFSRCTKAPVPVVRGYLPDAPRGHFLITLHGDIEGELQLCAPDAREDIAARVVKLDAMWPHAFDLLETCRLAAAVDVRRYWDWSSSPEADSGGGIMGLISVAEQAGMRCQSGSRFSSERYGMLSCHGHCRDLPSLLFHYLSVYAEQLPQLLAQGR